MEFLWWGENGCKPGPNVYQFDKAIDEWPTMVSCRKLMLVKNSYGLGETLDINENQVAGLFQRTFASGSTDNFLKSLIQRCYGRMALQVWDKSFKHNSAINHICWDAHRTLKLSWMYRTELKHRWFVVLCQKADVMCKKEPLVNQLHYKDHFAAGFRCLVTMMKEAVQLM